jgi:hypothetical protein
MWVYLRAEWQEWQPWANTFAYYPLNSTSTVNDQKGNKNLTITWTATFWTYAWVDCCYINWWMLQYWAWGWGAIVNSTDPHTTSIWYNQTQATTSDQVTIIWFSDFVCSCEYERTAPNYVSNKPWIVPWDQRWSRTSVQAVSINNDTWYNIVVVWDVTNLKYKLYVNWTLTTDSVLTVPNFNSEFISMGYPSKTIYGYFSDAIFENAAWSGTDVSDYYNLTKSNYWL